MAINGLNDEVEEEKFYSKLVSEGYFDIFRDFVKKRSVDGDPKEQSVLKPSSSPDSAAASLVNRKETVSDSNGVPNEQPLPDSGSSSQGGA